MRKFDVKVWHKSGTYHESDFDAENQCDALMKVMKMFSKDGIHCPMNIKIHIKPTRV